MNTKLLAITVCLFAFRSLNAQPAPVFYEGFGKGKIEGPVGKAGTRFAIDASGVINMERGTIAFFYQSAKAPAEREWSHVAAVNTDRDAGYWTMGITFTTRRQDFIFNFYDAGAYAPPMHLPTVFGRWKAGEWHHLAAVWDRYNGITIYENGKQVASNSGKYQWHWNVLARTFRIYGPSDEIHVFAEPLTASQIGQLAKGKEPTGDPIPVIDDEKRQSYERSRWGWTGDNLKNIPEVDAGSGVRMAFARINGCIDAKRPVAYPYEGLLRTSWPGSKYGPSVRGHRLEISLDEGQSYDRVRLFAQRYFRGRLLSGTDKSLISLNASYASFLHAKLPAALDDTSLVLERDGGQIGHIDFYRSEALADSHLPKQTLDFHFSKAESFPDTPQGKVLMAEVPRRFWNPLQGVEAEPAAWILASPVAGGFQAITDAPSEPRAFDGVLVELAVESLTEPTPVRIEIKEPVDTERIWLAGDIILRPGPGKQTYRVMLQSRPVINRPPFKRRKYIKDGRFSETDFIEEPGIGFSVKVTAGRPVTWRMGKGGTKVSFSLANLDQVRETAADDQIEWMREAYAERMEGHQFGDPRIKTPLVWLAHFAPERMEFRQMWERVDARKPRIVGMDIPPLKMPEVKNDTGAPDWAFWQMQAVDKMRKHLHWIIDEKQVWTGEYGGLWNDDSTHVENWMGYMLCIDGSGKIKESMDRYWEGSWNYQLTEGVGKYTQDAGHYSEEGSSTLGMKLLIDYGDPVAYARTMQSGAHVKNWIADDPEGGYLFTSFWVGPEGAWTEGAFRMMQKKRGHMTDVLVPLGYLTWYNRHPKAGDYLIGLDTSGGGFLGAACHQAKDWAARRKQLAEDVLKPLGRYGPREHIIAIGELGMSDDIRKAHKAEYRPLKDIMHYWGSKHTDLHWFQWKVSGDDRFLVDSYQRVCQWFYSHDWLNGPAQPSMDRNPLPRGSVIRSRLGTLAANRGSSGNMWPQHALSYTRGADEVAALVTENIPNKFAVRLYPFTERPHQLQIRAWRCNGRFTVALAGENGVLWTKEMDLDRGAYIDLTLPPKQTSVLSVTPIKTVPIDFDRADPAISVSSIELVYGEHLTVRVYNNGRKPVDDVVVHARDARSGELLVNGVKHTGPIAAPLDLKPRFRTVEFKNVNAWDRIIVEIDPDKKNDDLTRHNNRVDFDFKGSFDRFKGWR